MLEYQNITRNPDHLSGTVSGFNFPLMFDPGDDFAYGIGVDWAGYMVQRLDGRSIDRFVADEILRPLGLTDTVFEADSLRDRLADPVLRRPGGFVPFEMSPPAHPEMYGMGHSLYGTASDYARLLRLVLNGGELDGYRVISKETHQLVVTNQMGDTLVPDPIYSFVPDTSATINLLEGIPKTHTASFFRNEAAVPYGRSEGSLTWGGFMNTHFWIDPVKDIAAVFMSQSCPFYDPAFMAVYAQFEREVYSLFRA
jgi:methyl acetate hydrolase